MKTTIEKTDGKCDTAQAVQWLNSQLAMKANGVYELTLQKQTRRRSLDQNRLMWLWFTIIAEQWSEACGYAITSQNVHDTYCLLLLPVTTPKGTVGGTTKGLTTEQFTDFLNKVQADVAAEYGIELPQPDDLRLAEIAEMYGL